MAISNQPTRKLPYPLYDTLQLVGENIPTSDEIIQLAWENVPNNEQQTIAIKLSLDEYVALASCVDVGRDIAYGEDSELIWWIWNRIFQGMSICDEVNECITTNSTVQASISNVVINNGSVNPNSIDPDTTTGGERVPNSDTQSIAEPPPSCDKDALWAGIREMVDRIDQNGRDVLEDLQFINDKIEQWAELVDLVPLLGDTIKDISDLFTAQVPDLLNAYNAASSPTFLDNVACDLFEMVCNECRYPTFDEVFNYFGGLSYFSLPSFSTMTYGALWNSIKTITGAVPESLWYSVNVWQCFTLGIGGTFKRSYGAKTFEIWASFGEDNPNNNWEILCDGCADTWCYQWDTSTGFADWTILVGSEDIDGILAGYIIESGDRQYKMSRATITTPVPITRFEFDFYFDNSTFYNTGAYWDSYVDGVRNFQTTGIGSSLTGQGFTKGVDIVGTVIQLEAVAAKQIGLTQDLSPFFCHITAIRLYGNGANPYGVNNCP